MKNRNSFFSSSNNQAVGYINPNGYGFNEEANFYQGNIPNNMINYNNNNYYNDIDARLSKVERNIARLNERINKLESSTLYSSNDESDNMYII